MQLQRIPYSPTSSATALVNARSEAFDVYIMGLPDHSVESRRRREVQDHSRPALQHRLLQHLSRAQHGCRDIDRDRLIPVLQCLLPNPPVLTRRSRVVTHDIDMTELVHSSCHHRDDVVLVGHIRPHADSASTRIGRCLLDQLLSSCRQQHLRSLLDEY